MHIKHNERNGFTLAELLIVVAIIGVLVAISIPIFNHQLEKAREATDLANIRSAYAVLQAAAIAEESYYKIRKHDTENISFFHGTNRYYLDPYLDRSHLEESYTASIYLTQHENGWISGPLKVYDESYSRHVPVVAGYELTAQKTTKAQEGRVEFIYYPKTNEEVMIEGSSSGIGIITARDAGRVH